jgi:nitrate reductase gamma subunit
MGTGMVCEGREQVQNLLLAHSAKQVVDKLDLPIMPHLSIAMHMMTLCPFASSV